MSRTDFEQKLAEKLEEEANGYSEYMEMSEQAQKHGYEDISKVLKDMAKEEKIHHEMLLEMKNYI